MTLPTTEKDLTWLWERLYEASRRLQATGVQSPVFVLVTRNAGEREIVEGRIIKHFEKAFGIHWVNDLEAVQNMTRFHLACGIQLVLIDIE